MWPVSSRVINSRNANVSVLAWLVLAALLGAFLGGCSSSRSGLEVTDAWGRPSPETASTAAFYLTVENSGPEDDRLTGVTAAACGEAMIHQTTIDEQGIMQMSHTGQVTIPAGETVRFEPGGLHIMCTEKKSVLRAGDPATLLLSFDLAGEVAVEVEIQEQ